MRPSRLLLPSITLLLAACATPPPRAPASPAASVTGVPSCDAYLASYVACHRAAGIFPPDQLESRFQTMRNSLLDAAHDPQSRRYLDARCRVLATQLAQALHGRTCGNPPPR